VAENRSAGPPVAAIGYLLFNGFLVNQYGILTWNTTSAWHIAVFVVAAALGLGVRYLRHLHAETVFDAELRQLTGTVNLGLITRHPRGD
jgi:protein-S-isoprenylcysteine O-methyltransferase Ste14